MTESYSENLKALAASEIGQHQFGAPLAEHNSWHIGGPADLLIEPASIDQVASVVRFTRQHNVPLMVIGEGTNLLFDDAGLRGVVMKLGEKFSQVEVEGGCITAEAGAWVPGVARKAMQSGLVGLEHTIGIPGTIGGLVLMNGGSQRKGIGENVARVWVVDREGSQKVLSCDECDFSYRHSALQGTGYVVVKVELECEQGDPKQVRRMMLEDLRERRRKFPRKEPNCGSVFLSTSEMHASVGPPGKVVENAGLKGTRIGNAEISHQHANFIVNRGGASSHDVLELIAHVRKVVQNQIGFELCCEVRYVSPQGVVVPAHLALG